MRIHKKVSLEDIFIQFFFFTKRLQYSRSSKNALLICITLALALIKKGLIICYLYDQHYSKTHTTKSYYLAYKLAQKDFRQIFLYMNKNIVSLIWTTLSFWPAQKGMFEDLAYFYTTLYLMIFIESIGIAAAPAIKPQLSLPLAKLFTLSRTASNHDFLISILLLAWWYDDSAAALTGKMLAVVALELERFGGW